MIRTPRQAAVAQSAQSRPRQDRPLHLLLDLTTLEKCGKFLPLSPTTADPEHPDPRVRRLNGNHGLPLVVLYLVRGEWRVPWSVRVWRGQGQPRPAAWACKLLATLPQCLSQGAPVIVLADTEFGTVALLKAVRRRTWRAVVGRRCTRKRPEGRSLKQRDHQSQRGQPVQLQGSD